MHTHASTCTCMYSMHVTLAILWLTSAKLAIKGLTKLVAIHLAKGVVFLYIIIINYNYILIYVLLKRY